MARAVALRYRRFADSVVATELSGALSLRPPKSVFNLSRLMSPSPPLNSSLKAAAVHVHSNAAERRRVFLFFQAPLLSNRKPQPLPVRTHRYLHAMTNIIARKITHRSRRSPPAALAGSLSPARFCCPSQLSETDTFYFSSFRRVSSVCFLSPQ